MRNDRPVWIECLLSVWVVLVGVFAIGGTLAPTQIGVWTTRGAAAYAVVLLTAVVFNALNYLRRSPAASANPARNR